MPALKPVPKNYVRRIMVADHKNFSLAEVTLRAPVPGPFEFFAEGRPYVVLDEVYTEPKHRGQGLSPACLELAKAICRESGWSILCRPQAHKSKMGQAKLVAFYRKHGWGRLVKDYPTWLAWPPA